MFTEQRLMFIYCISPVHMGSGTSLGVIDNPVQRERHTGHPVLAGSAIKGALRHAAGERGLDKNDLKRIFGPENQASDHAGAASFADGQVVIFPVRSLKGGFVYATSPIALKRLERLASITGALSEGSSWNLPEVDDKTACVLTEGLLSSDKKLILESYAFGQAKDTGELEEASNWLAQNALPSSNGHGFFSDKLKSDLVLLSDSQFSFFVRNSTSVEPHVRIEDASGTASDGGLFFTENVPPEALFVSIAMTGEERMKKGSKGEPEKAASLIQKIVNAFDGKSLQIGGDATTGRGQVVLRFVNGGAQ